MAEQFEKPKKFTAEWFSYIWHYYKVHIICVLAAVFLAGITVYEIVNTTEYDMTVNYVAANVVRAETQERFLAAATQKIEDITHDGERNISMAQLNFTSDAMQDGNQLMALENKLMTLFASPDEMMFLFDEMLLQDVLSMSSTEGIFIPVEEWCKETVEEDRLYQFENTAYAVNLSDSKMLQELGIDGSDLFVAVRMNYDDTDENLNKLYENCKQLANALVQ